jgi:hypothetical protein
MLAVGQGGGAGAAGQRAPVGRAAELGVVERFLAPDRAGRVLVVCGEPGIGKSHLWEAGVDQARSRGFAVWSARPSEAEAQLSFAGLADLLDGAGAGVLAGLPVPQRRALEVAVRRAEPDLVPPEPLAIAAGLLGVLRAASDGGPVLVGVDDLPWLDGESASAVVFAARRLAGADVRFLVSRRSGKPTGLETAAEPAGVVRVELGPLSFGAISGLLADRLTAPLPRRVARQVFEVSGAIRCSRWSWAGRWPSTDCRRSALGCRCPRCSANCSAPGSGRCRRGCGGRCWRWRSARG